MFSSEDFQSFNLSLQTLESLLLMGYKKPTEIQRKSIPIILKGEDLVAQAQTGTGKTAAFGIPIVEKINPFRKEIQALILVPTRELALQVGEEIRSIGKKKKLFVFTFYGGKPIFEQVNFLNKKIGKILVGTPGRIKDLLERGYLHLKGLEILVLDEADRLLDMGFIEDMKDIISYLPKERQTLLFSATLGEEVLNLAKNYMKPEYKAIVVKPEELLLKQIDQKIYKISSHLKLEKLVEILNYGKYTKTLIFVQTKIEAENLAQTLFERGFLAQAIHGDYPQRKREKIMKDFRTGRFNLLVATDVASRGLDIKNLELVINYGLPKDPNSYIHRIGRTGRTGEKGTAISIMTYSEEKSLKNILLKTKANLKINTA